MERRYRTKSLVGIMLLLLGDLGCSASSPAFGEGQALLSQGKLEEAAARFERVCAEAPLAETCAQADKQAAETRLKLAAQHLEQGKFVLAEQQALLAVGFADEATKANAHKLLESEDLKQGLLFERASTHLSPELAIPVIEKVAGGSSKAAPLAKTWLETKRTPLLLATAKSACGPARRGSCSQAWEALKASGTQSPDVDEVRKLAEAEQKRVKPLRAQAESFLAVFAEQKKKQLAFKTCLETKPGAVDECSAEANGEGGPQGYKTRFLAQQNTDKLFRKLLKNIADQAIVDELLARKKQALETGEVPKSGGKQ